MMNGMHFMNRYDKLSQSDKFSVARAQIKYKLTKKKCLNVLTLICLYGHMVLSMNW